MITANVRPQVARRVGQRTCLSSVHAPLKYPPIDLKGFASFFKDLSFDTFCLQIKKPAAADCQVDCMASPL
jgi:hypothetical protein